jgi:hypothetical protein
MKYLLLTLAILSFGCKEKRIDIEYSRTLSQKYDSKMNHFTSGNLYINVVDTFLVAVRGEEPAIRIFSTNSHKLIAEFGRNGRGPNEFLSATVIKQDEYANESAFIIHDWKRNRISIFPTSKIPDNLDSIDSNIIPSDNIFMTFFHYAFKDGYISTPLEGGNLYFYKEKAQSRLIEYEPKIDDLEIDKRSLSSFYRPAVGVNKIKNKVVSAPIRFPRIDFYTIEGSYEKSTIFDKLNTETKKELERGSSALSESKTYIYDLDWTNEMILALNADTKVKDMNQKISNNKLLIFDWDGNLIDAAQFDSKNLFGIAYDPVHNRLYANDLSNDVTNIVYYEAIK